MKGQTARDKVGRRDFFRKAAGAVGVAGVAAATLGAGGKSKAAAKPAAASGYRETEHVRTYYRLAKF